MTSQSHEASFMLKGSDDPQQATPVPPSWQILPIPRVADYGAADDFLTLGKVAIVRQKGSPYQTVRDEASELVGESTITEEDE